MINMKREVLYLTFLFYLISDDLNGISFGIDSDGNWGYIKAGADTVIPFKTGNDYNFEITVRAVYDNTGSDALYDRKFIYKNGNWTSSDIQKDNGSGTAIKWGSISIISFKLL